jgi:ABC-type antimicrobial peptide transport system permease subunit
MRLLAVTYRGAPVKEVGIRKVLGSGDLRAVLLGTGIILVLGLLTIASQTIRASRLNPVESLRSE